MLFEILSNHFLCSSLPVFFFGTQIYWISCNFKIIAITLHLNWFFFRGICFQKINGISAWGWEMFIVISAFCNWIFNKNYWMKYLFGTNIIFYCLISFVLDVSKIDQCEEMWGCFSLNIEYCSADCKKNVFHAKEWNFRLNLVCLEIDFLVFPSRFVQVFLFF